MKPNVILLLNADPDVEKALNEVASQRGHELVTARTAAESFRILRDGAKDVKLVLSTSILRCTESLCSPPLPIFARMFRSLP